MKTNIIEKTENKIELVLEDASPEIANAIRRAITTKVPTLAVRNVEFNKNSSALYDEILALRIGLIPLKTDLKTYNRRESCTCKNKGCSKCTVKLALKKQGPGTVYAEEFKSSDKNVVPVYPKTPIVVLNEGQEIELTAIAELGTSYEHAKWSPGHAFYRYYPSIKVTKKGEKQVELAEKCPHGALAVKGDKLVVVNEIACDLSCSDEFDEEYVKIKGIPNKIIFTIESWGQLSPEEMWSQAISILVSELKDFKKQIK